MILDMVNKVTGKTINRKSHRLGHFGKALCFHLVLIRKGWEIGSFAMDMRFDEGKCGAHSI